MTHGLFDIPVPPAPPARELAYSFCVYGNPAPQGSKHATLHKTTGRIVVMESSKHVKPWRESVRYAGVTERGSRAPLDGVPLIVDMVFTFVRPKSHYRTGRNAHLLRDNAPCLPMTAPDVSKLVRSTEDALTNAGVWRDDALVSGYGRAQKVWAGSGDPDALDTPGVVIRIYTIGATK